MSNSKNARALFLKLGVLILALASLALTSLPAFSQIINPGGSSVFPQNVSGTVTSGGIICFTSTSVASSSGILNSNVLVKGGGAGVCPTNSLWADNGTVANYTGTGGVTVGTAPTVTTPGTGFYVFGTEGTEPASIAAGTTGFVTDSSSHCNIVWNNAVNVGCAAALGAIETFTAAQTFGTGDILLPANVGTSAANGPLTMQAGIDAATTGAAAIFISRGEDVNGGSTASLAGGAATLRGGNNASTGNTNAGGAANVIGGDATGGTGTGDTGGNTTARGGNCTSTTGSCTPGTLTDISGGFTGAFTNGAASDHLVQSGLGTGNAAVSHVKIQSPALGLASGITAQAQITRFVSHTKAGSTTSATATTVFNIASATNTAWGLEILVHVDLISSTPNVCGTTERISLTGTNNNGAFGTVNVTPATISTLCSAGTLTLVATATAANPSVISITPTWATITSITSATITIEIENPSQQEIALL